MQFSTKLLLLTCSLQLYDARKYTETPPPENSVTSPPEINYCESSQMSLFHHVQRRASNQQQTLCLLNNPKTEQCQFWRVVSVIVLDSTTKYTEAQTILSDITSFLNAITSNCDHRSRLQFYTVDNINKTEVTPAFYEVGTDELANFEHNLLTPELATLPDNIDPGDAFTDLLTTVYEQSANTITSAEGAVLYVFLNSKCKTLCKNYNFTNNEDQLVSLFDKAKFVVRFMYLDDSDEQIDCIKKLFLACTRYQTSLCDAQVYGLATDTLASNADSIVVCPSDTTSMLDNVLVVVLPAFFVMIIVIAGMCLRYKKYVARLRLQFFGSNDPSCALKPETRSNLYTEYINDKMENGIEKDDWEVDPGSMTVFNKNLLGSGAFADVYKGAISGRLPLLKVNPNLNLLIDFNSNGTTVYPTTVPSRFPIQEVAVKRLPKHANDENRRELFREIEFMKNLGYHAHITSMIGCVSHKIEPMIVVEYCANGDLLHFIRRHKKHILLDRHDVCPIDVELCLRIKNLISFAWQIADGMIYLASKNFVHRDLAARNILITKDLVAKISDFGLCRELNTSQYTSKGGRLPIKWMALESLKYFEFSTASDVYALMKTFWNIDPKERPSFNKIRDDITLLLNADDEDYGYITIRNPQILPKVDVEREPSVKKVETRSKRKRSASLPYNQLSIPKVSHRSGSVDIIGRFIVNRLQSVPDGTAI